MNAAAAVLQIQRMSASLDACCRGWVCACRLLPAAAPNWMAISSAAAHHHRHLSPALQGDHDSSIPLHLPLIFGFVASFTCGVLNFGEAMTFTLLWNFARYLGWLASDVTYAKGVVYSQVMQ